MLALIVVPASPAPLLQGGAGLSKGHSTAARVGALALGVMSRLIQVVRMMHQVGWGGLVACAGVGAGRFKGPHWCSKK